MSIFANTTVISNLASIDRLDLLRQLYRTLHIPIEVFSEIQDGLDEGYAFYTGIDRLVHPLNDEGWIHLTGLSEDELRLFSRLPARLHKGEAACIAIANFRGLRHAVGADDRRGHLRQAQLPRLGNGRPVLGRDLVHLIQHGEALLVQLLERWQALQLAKAAPLVNRPPRSRTR